MADNSLTFYKTASTRTKRLLIGDDATYVRLCVDKRLLPHVIGFLNQMADQFDGDGEQLCLELIEQAFNSTPCQWGATFRTVDESLEQSQPDGPLPPWEFQLSGENLEYLEYRTKEE